MLNNDDFDAQAVLEGERDEPEVWEECDDCAEETPHYTEVRIVKEGDKAYSREPYRFSKCFYCGNLEKTRMNNQ